MTGGQLSDLFVMARTAFGYVSRPNLETMIGIRRAARKYEARAICQRNAAVAATAPSTTPAKCDERTAKNGRRGFSIPDNTDGKIAAIAPYANMDDDKASYVSSEMTRLPIE